MSTCSIKGIPVNFPFEPYEIQKNYMEKVIDCLQNHQNGVLESPTGTGKTLSLLCSSLAWLEMKKAQLQAQRLSTFQENVDNDFLKELQRTLDAVGSGANTTGRTFLGVPTIIYASRTHSQLSQAMQELKRTSYKHMKACVLGSREQTCIHPEIVKEINNSTKIHLCRLKVKERACNFYNRVERVKEMPDITNLSIIDIEDIVKLGQNHKFCPYYMTKELKQQADIIFMPYNYLLDPKIRKSLGVELSGNVVILDEAHNIENICEDSASHQIKSTDITLCVEEVTAVMKIVSEDRALDFNDKEVPKDFTPEELCRLKEILLNFEKVLDAIPLTTTAPEGTYFKGNYILDMLSNAGINDSNFSPMLGLLEKLIQFLTTASGGEGPFQRRGNGLQLFSDLLTTVYTNVSQEYRQKIKKCYKVHITTEDPRRKVHDNWLSKATAKAQCRVLSYWCFSPGFGMSMLMDQGIHCVILTSGTLAPLAPLISELELNVGVTIENPHIVDGTQVCVKILTQGPDKVPLNCNYQNRDNPLFLQSLGSVIMNLIRSIPGGVLIFFPSYPIMLKCQQYWQETGLWGGITQLKAIFVEPRDKNQFNSAMNDYYAKVKDPNLKGAIFMGVCRGKVSEGLDFADINGRAVFIIGLPYPPLKDPKIILKKRYMDVCNATDRQFLKGDDWYRLEATRAINQAIGRVIRHRHDYGAIILLDSRFASMNIRNNMSKWLREHIKVVQNFGEIVRDLRAFFINAEAALPAPKEKAPIGTVVPPPAEFEVSAVYKNSRNFDFSSSSATSTDSENSSGLVNIHKRKFPIFNNVSKRKKITVVANSQNEDNLDTSIKEFVLMVKKALDNDSFKKFTNAMAVYRAANDLQQLKECLSEIFLPRHNLRYIVFGVEHYIKERHRNEFKEFCESMQ